MCSFDGIQRGNYFGGKPVGKVEVESISSRMDEITGEMIKGEGGGVDFESEDWRFFYCIKVSERGLNVRIIEVLAC